MEEPTQKKHPSARHEVTISVQPVDTPEDDGVLKKAYRKVDRRLLTFYAFVSFVLVIGSHNIANAAIMNTEQRTDIKHQLGDLSSEQWAMVLSIFMYPHIIFEPISTLLVKKLSPRTWLSRIIITWGIITMCQSAVSSFGGMMACRALLGLAEAGFVPGLLYHLSFWYPAERLPMRIAFLSAIAQLAGALSGVCAFGISYLNGHLGLAGWQYLFIIEGALVVLCGMISMLYLPNYPDGVNFLTEEERSAIQGNLPPTQPHSDEKTWSREQAKDFLRDWTSYTFVLIWICHAIGGGGIFTVLPTVVLELGLTGSTSSQLMTMPPYLVGAAALLCIAYLIQKKKMKSWVAALCLESLAGACYVALIVVEQPLVKYFVLMLAAIWSFGVHPILWPEVIRASEGATNAGLAIGITAAAGGLHGLVGPQIYQTSFGPTYRVSFSVSVGLTCASVASIAATWALLRRKQRKVINDQEDEKSETTPEVNKVCTGYLMRYAYFKRADEITTTAVPQQGYELDVL